MTDQSTVNLSSLSIISAELEETLVLAQRGWRDFRENTNDFTPLKSAAQCFNQINGALRIVELRGMQVLTEELQAFTDSLVERGHCPSDVVLVKVQSCIDCQIRYLDYVRASGQGKPTLLIPAINEIRAFNSRQRFPENHFSCIDITGTIALPELDTTKELDIEKLSLTIRRLRQMYQTGLIGILRSDPPAMHLGLMQRACERMYGLLRSCKAADAWLLQAALVAGMATDQLELTSSRIRCLASIDRGFKHMLSNLETALQQSLEAETQNEYVYLLSLLEEKSPLAKIALANLEVNTLDHENTLREERAYIYGVNIALEEERLQKITMILGSMHEYLDTSSRANQFVAADLQKLGNQLDELIMLLGEGGAGTLLEILKARRLEVARWIEEPDTVSWDGLMPLADALIMVEGTVENAAPGIGDTIDVVGRADASALQSAELAVVSEAQAGLSLAKRAITSYVESGYDRAHLGNIATTLNTVRGGLQLLHLNRAADILVRSTHFIESSIESSISEDQGILETLADALISLEYYLGQLELRRGADESVLDVADESLREIGYPAAVA